MSEGKQRAAAIAQRQHGVITMLQAVEKAGMTVDEVRHLVDTGIWDRTSRGLLTVCGAPLTYACRVMAACLSAGPHALACRQTVARLLDAGRPYFGDAEIEIVVPKGLRARSAAAQDVIVHQSRSLVTSDRCRVGAVPTTAAPRLIIDLLSVCTPEALWALADDLFWRKLATPTEVRRAWARAGGGRQLSALEAVVLPWASGRVTWPQVGSPKEMSLSRMLQLHGLPRPARQHKVYDAASRREHFLDLAYVAERIAPEYDGRLAHGPRQWLRDCEREDRLAASGWIRIPAGRLDLVEPGATAFCDTVRAALTFRRGVGTNGT